MCEIEFEGLVYPSTEHAYQAAKFSDTVNRTQVRDLEKPAMARKAGVKATVPANWHTERKFQVMKEVLAYKFTKHEDLRQKLLDTKNIELVEGNGWHDNDWGSCFCEDCGNQGNNYLGKMLMEIREQIRKEENSEPKLT